MSGWLRCADYVPFWKRQDPETQDNFGRTIAIYWIIHFKKEPPEWMKHDPTIQDEYGRTIAMLWIIYVKTKHPEIEMDDVDDDE